MIDEMDLRKSMDRAAKAKALMSDDILMDAFDGVKSELLAAWEHTPSPSTGDRERIWLAYKAIDSIRNSLEVYIQDGTIAAHELAKIYGDHMGEA